MISRLSAFAAIFAIVTTASLAFAASSHEAAQPGAAKLARVVQLERVVITAKRLPQVAR